MTLAMSFAFLGGGVLVEVALAGSSNVLMASSAPAVVDPKYEADQLVEALAFTITHGVCPYTSLTTWKQYKKQSGSLTECESACTAANCSLFTWNHAVKPKQCWGYAGPHPSWAMKPDAHCDSGCLKSRVPNCGEPPLPPPPPSPSPPPGPLPPDFPRYVGPRPRVSINASAGLRPIPDVEHVTVYNATVNGHDRNPFGVYGHGPMITKYMGLYYISWYNAPVGETQNKRSVYATASDVRGPWSAPAVLFPTFTASDHGINEDGEENGPWTILNGRLYTQSGSNDAGEHHEDIISVMRQVGVGGNSSALGEPFWLNRTVPAYCKGSALQKSPDCKYKTYLEMDAQTRSDAEQLLASFVRTLVRAPDASVALTKTPAFPRMVYNERSLYMLPESRRLALLLRGVHGGLSVAMCDLPAVPTEHQETLFSCRSGVGDAFMNLVEIVKDYSNSSDPRLCNWTAPVLSTLPDSGSRTCASTFPTGTQSSLAGSIYLVGNQIDKGRDPVTLSIAKDGVQFDEHFAVRYGVKGADIDHGGSCPRFQGAAKGCGYQYPGAMIDVENQEMIVTYSIGKEDIALTVFSLAQIVPH